jgi:hypothetical protein
VVALDSKDRAALLCDAKTGKALLRTALPADCGEPAALAANSLEMLWVFDADAKCVLQYRSSR